MCIRDSPNTGEILVMASRKLVGDKIIDNVNSILISPITPGSVVTVSYTHLDVYKRQC